MRRRRSDVEQEDAEAPRRLTDMYFSRVTVVLFCEIAPLRAGLTGSPADCNRSVAAGAANAMCGACNVHRS